MDLIKHTEFGLSYCPIISKNLRYPNSNHINHWLEQWHLLYGKLMEFYVGNPNVMFVNGGLLHSGKSWQKICTFLAIDDFDFDFRDVRKNINVDCNQGLLEKCMKLYHELDKISI